MSECPGTGEGVSECPGTGEGVSGSWWSYSGRTSNSRERDRGEKSTGEQGERLFNNYA